MKINLFCLFINRGATTPIVYIESNSLVNQEIPLYRAGGIKF